MKPLYTESPAALTTSEKLTAQEVGKACDMVIIEAADGSCTWECSSCKTERKASARFEKSKKCPACGAVINTWIGADE